MGQARAPFTSAMAIAVMAFMDLRSMARQTLLDYLDADLTLAMTFVDVARGHYRRGNSPVGDRCKSHAEIALRTVRVSWQQLTSSLKSKETR
jgi:hypothetical protein